MLHKTRFPRTLRLAIGSTLASLVLLAQTGCLNYFIMLGYFIGGMPTITPDFERTTGNCMTDLDDITDEPVQIAVACYAPEEMLLAFDSVDQEVGRYVTAQLASNKIEVVPYERVHAWMDEHPNWDRPDEIGEALGVRYVVYIDLNKFSLYEEGSAHLYRGRTDALISVYEMDADGIGEVIYKKDVSAVYPSQIARSTDEMTYSAFRKQYMRMLSNEIGKHFYPVESAGTLTDAQ